MTPPGKQPGSARKRNFPPAKVPGNLAFRIPVGAERDHPEGPVGGDLHGGEVSLDQGREFSEILDDRHRLVSEMDIGVEQVGQVDHQHAAALGHRSAVERDRRDRLEAGGAPDGEGSGGEFSLRQRNRFGQRRGDRERVLADIEPDLAGVADRDLFSITPLP